MFCSECGAKLSEGSLMCSACGAFLDKGFNDGDLDFDISAEDNTEESAREIYTYNNDDDTAGDVTAVQPPQSRYGALRQQTEPQTGQHGETYPETAFIPKRKHKPRLIFIPVIAAAVVVVMAAGAFAAFTFFKRDVLQLIQGESYSATYVKGLSGAVLDSAFEGYGDTLNYEKGTLSFDGKFSITKEGVDKIITALESADTELPEEIAFIKGGFNTAADYTLRYDITGGTPKVYAGGNLSYNDEKLLSPEAWFDGKTATFKIPEVSDDIVSYALDSSDDYTTESIREIIEVFEQYGKIQKLIGDNPALREATKAVFDAALAEVPYKLEKNVSVEINGKQVKFDAIKAELTTDDYVKMASAIIDVIANNAQYADTYYEVATEVAALYSPSLKLTREQFDSTLKMAKTALDGYKSTGNTDVAVTLEIYVDVNNDFAGLCVSTGGGNGNVGVANLGVTDNIGNPAAAYNLTNAASVGIIGGADGPTSILLADRNVKNLISVPGGVGGAAGYSFCAVKQANTGYTVEVTTGSPSGGVAVSPTPFDTSIKIYGDFNNTASGKSEGNVNIAASYSGDSGNPFDFKLCDFSDLDKNGGTFAFSSSDIIDLMLSQSSESRKRDSNINWDDFRDIKLVVSYKGDKTAPSISTDMNSGIWGFSQTSNAAFSGGDVTFMPPAATVKADSENDTAVKRYGKKVEKWWETADNLYKVAMTAGTCGGGGSSVAVILPTVIGYVSQSRAVVAAATEAAKQATTSPEQRAAEEKAKEHTDKVVDEAYEKQKAAAEESEAKKEYNDEYASQIASMAQDGIDDLASINRSVKNGEYIAESKSGAWDNTRQIKTVKDIIKAVSTQLPTGAAASIGIEDNRVVYIFYSTSGKGGLPDESYDTFWSSVETGIWTEDYISGETIDVPKKPQ